MLRIISETGPDFRKGEFQEAQTSFCKVIPIPIPTPVELITDKMILRLCFFDCLQIRFPHSSRLSTHILLSNIYGGFFHQFSILSYLAASMCP